MDIPLTGAGPDEARDEAWEVVRTIFRAWRERRPEDMRPLLHPDIVMVFPGAAERATGVDSVMEGFIAFSAEAVPERVEARDRQLDVVGNTAVASYVYTLVYSRAGHRYRASGRDWWVLEKRGSGWLAVWRTMLELEGRELQ
jgi:ketosteroid isomerase-like protein